MSKSSCLASVILPGFDALAFSWASVRYLIRLAHWSDWMSRAAYVAAPLASVDAPVAAASLTVLGPYWIVPFSSIQDTDGSKLTPE